MAKARSPGGGRAFCLWRADGGSAWLWAFYAGKVVAGYRTSLEGSDKCIARWDLLAEHERRDLQGAVVPSADFVCEVVEDPLLPSDIVGVQEGHDSLVQVARYLRASQLVDDLLDALHADVLCRLRITPDDVRLRMSLAPEVLGSGIGNGHLVWTNDHQSGFVDCLLPDGEAGRNCQVEFSAVIHTSRKLAEPF